jgi:molybdate transport system substrate-binding protein
VAIPFLSSLRFSYVLECGGRAPLSRSKARRPNSRRLANSIGLSVLLSSLRFSYVLGVFAAITAIPLLSFAQQPQLNVAAAADLKFAMTEFASAYEKQSGVKLNLTFGSSGNFFAQIQNGAPFDLFFSADSEYPRKLDEAGLVVPNSTYQYAVGRLVLWTPADSKVDLTKSGWNALLDPSIRKIAIANPDHAPYGRAAIEALKKSGYYDQVKSKLVFGENISQAAQFVQSGSAQAGILARSLVLAPAFSSGHTWLVPQDHYSLLIQSAVVLKHSPNQPAALAFLAYIKTGPAQTILEKYGFQRPKSTSHALNRFTGLCDSAFGGRSFSSDITALAHLGALAPEICFVRTQHDL